MAAQELNRGPHNSCPECGHSVEAHMNTIGCYVALYKFPDTPNFEGGYRRCLCEWLPSKGAA